MLQKQQFFRVFYNFALIGFLITLLFSVSFNYARAEAFSIVDWGVYQLVSAIGALVSYIGSSLDYAIKEFIIGFGENFQRAGFGFAVNNLWTTFRDLFNLALIFGLVYIGFQIILGINDSQAKRTIGLLIVAALLVNFSLFITKFIIDFSNIAATEIYQLFQTEAGGQADISLAFTNAIQVSAVLATTATDATLSGLVYLLLLLIVFSVLIYVFVAAAILVSIRFVVLVFCMIFSPLMFIGWVIPGLKNMTNKFWNTFLGQAFFAPALMFMLYISYVILLNYNDGQIYELNAAVSLGAEAVFTRFVPFYILMCVFLVASLIVAKNMGAYGAATVLKVGDNLQKGTRKALLGAGGYLAYKGLDRAANSENALARYTGARMVSRGLSKYTGIRDVSEKAYKESYFGKSSAAVERRTNEMSGREAEVKRQRDIDAGISTATELANLRERSRFEELDRKVASGTASQDEETEHQSILTSLGGTPTPLSTDERTKLGKLEQIELKMARAVTDLSTKQLENMITKERAKIAGFLTESQTETFMKSEKVSESDKGALMKARKDAVRKIVEKNGEILGEAVGKLTISQIETLGEDWINSNAHYLTTGQLDELKKSKKFTESQKGRFTSSRKSNLSSIASTGGRIEFNRLFNGRKAEDKARFGLSILTNPMIITNYLDKDVLHEIVRNKTLNEQERQLLKAAIVLEAGRNAHARKLENYLRTPEMQLKW